jgi:hypothetical protein
LNKPLQVTLALSSDLRPSLSPYVSGYKGYRENVSSFGFYNDTALLAPVTDFFLVYRFNRIKIVVPLAMYLKALGAIPLTQFVSIDDQMAVPAPQYILLLRQQVKAGMPA